MHPFIQSVLPAIAKAVAEAAISKGKSTKLPTTAERVEEAIRQHLKSVSRWTSQVHALDFAAPGETDRDTVAIGFDTEPRRFSSRRRQSTEMAEADLLRGDTHYLVLGNPGSGKSTAVKRLARRLLQDEPVDDTEIVDFPLVIRLRELDRGEPLFGALAKTLGIPYHIVEFPAKVSGTRILRTETRIGDVEITKALPAILSSFRPLVLLDGLDEVWSDERREIANEIALLSAALERGKLIVTSRPSEFVPLLDGLTAIELRPLELDQIRAIAERHLDDAEAFLTALERLPYRDIADRPLLLTQLTLLYKRYGFLPTQPSHVYRRVVRILLEEWDAQRRVTRHSNYADFDADKKADFLADIAYYLMYVAKQTQFSESALVAAYQRVHSRFGLPAEDATRVVKEIETHTGIIISTGLDSFEFSHLSIQEYLCASFLVRSGAPLLVRQALEQNAAAVAVAAAMSSQPSEWLSRIILAPEHQPWITRSGVEPFLHRLLVEKPGFEPYEPLGGAVIHLAAKHVKRDAKIPEVLERFMSGEVVADSIGLALRWYDFVDTRTGSTLMWLKKRDELGSSYDVRMPDEGAVPRSIIEALASRNPRMSISQREGRRSLPNTIERLLAGAPPLAES